MQELRPNGGSERRLRVVAILLLIVLTGAAMWGVAIAVVRAMT